MAAPTPKRHPNSELVALAWLRQVALIGATDSTEGPSTTLPKKPTTWPNGFLQAQSLVGRSPDVDLPVRRPLIQLDGWAAQVDDAGNVGDKPQWHIAADLLERVRLATEGGQEGRYSKRIVVRANYFDAIVQSVYLLTEIVRVTDDPSGYARFTADLAIDWVPAPDES